MAEDVSIRVGVDDRASAALRRVAQATEAVDKAAAEAGKGDDKAYVAAQRAAALLEESAKTQLVSLRLDEGKTREQRLQAQLLKSELELESRIIQIKAQGLSGAQEELEIERAKLATLKAQERLKEDDDKITKQISGPDNVDRDMAQLKAGAAAATVAIGAAVVAGAAFVGFLAESGRLAVDASRAYQEQAKGLKDLEDSLWAAGVPVDRLSAKMEAYEATVRQVSRQTNFSQPELLASMSKIVDLTGDAANAQKGLSLASAIATKRGEDLDEVSEKVAQAMKGEIEALEDLTPLTGQQADALRKIESDSARAVKALEFLEATYGGVLDGQDKTYLSMRALEMAQQDLRVALGEVISESGVFSVILEPMTRLLDWATKSVKDNEGALKVWILEGLDRGVEVVQTFTGVLGENADMIAGGVTVLRLGAGAFRIYLDIILAVNKAIFAFTTGILAGAVGAIEQLLFLATKAAEVVDEDLAVSLRAATDAAAETGERLAGWSLGAIDSAAGNVKDIGAAFSEMGEAIEQTDLIESKLRQGLKIVGDEATRARSEIVKLKAEAEKPGKGSRKARPPEAPKKPVVDDIAKRTAQEAARLRLQALDTQDKEIRAALEYQAKLKEIEGQQLKGAQGELARRQAALDAEKSLDEVLNDRARTQAILLRLETAGQEARTKGQQARAIEVEHQAKLIELRREDLTIEERLLKTRELEAERRLALRELEAEAINRQAEGWERVASGVGSAASGADGYGKMAGEGLAALVGGFGEIQASAAQAGAGIITAAQASQQGLAAAGGAVTGFAAALGASAAEQAGILALFETASAIASFAVGDFLGGGQHLVAAGLYTAVAATGGASAPSASASGGGAPGGGQAAPRGGRAQEDTSRRGAQVLAEEIAAAMGQSSAPVTVYYDYRGAVMADSPAGQRRLFEAAAGGGRQVGVDLDDLKVNRQGRKP